VEGSEPVPEKTNVDGTINAAYIVWYKKDQALLVCVCVCVCVCIYILDYIYMRALLLYYYLLIKKIYADQVFLYNCLFLFLS
jgi:hypothetical protein